MLRYSSRLEAPAINSADDTRNVLLLRSDLHHLFDQARFVFVPKMDAWVVHVLFGLPNEELASLYHNVRLQPLSELSVEFLFTRFAWAVLSQTIFLRPKRTGVWLWLTATRSVLRILPGLTASSSLLPLRLRVGAKVPRSDHGVPLLRVRIKTKRGKRKRKRKRRKRKWEGQMSRATHTDMATGERDTGNGAVARLTTPSSQNQ